MSHFTVLVIGQDPEEQLAPFDEVFSNHLDWESARYNEAKKINPYLKPEDWKLTRIACVDELPERARDFHEDVKNGKNHEDTLLDYVYAYYYGEIIIMPEGYYKRNPVLRETHDYNYGLSVQGQDRIKNYKLYFHGEESNYHRYGILDVTGGLDAIMSFKVPTPRWDWYVLGGRWRNYFFVKPEYSLTQLRYESPLLMEAKANDDEAMAKWKHHREDPRNNRVGLDSLQKKHIDFEAMYKHAYDKAIDDWQAYQNLVNGEYHKTWPEFLEEAGGDRDKARELREADPIDSLVRKSDFLFFDIGELELLRKPQKEYAELQARREYAPYAIIHNGEWISRGEMGWFGVGHGEVSIDDWVAKVQSIIDSLSDDTLLSLYDCHV